MKSFHGSMLSTVSEKLLMMTTSTNMIFPDWFPPGCPPADASAASGTVFRFATNNPIAVEDFLSHHELGLAPHADGCSRCSLSVYRTVISARKKLRELRKRFQDRFGPYIAEGTLNDEFGKIKQQGANSDHLEWWAYEGVERHGPFRIIESIDS